LYGFAGSVLILTSSSFLPPYCARCWAKAASLLALYLAANLPAFMFPPDTNVHTIPDVFDPYREGSKYVSRQADTRELRATMWLQCACEFSLYYLQSWTNALGSIALLRVQHSA
jgi:hypothetical protein